MNRFQINQWDFDDIKIINHYDYHYFNKIKLFKLKISILSSN